MPITKDKFDRIGGEGEHLDSKADRVLGFLIRNDDKAYTKSEIVEETSVTQENVGPVLDRLKERGSVERKSDYWRVSDHGLAALAGTALTAKAARQYDGGEEFDVEKWAEYAVEDPDRTSEKK